MSELSQEKNVENINKSEINEIKETNEINEINEIKEIKKINELNEITQNQNDETKLLNQDINLNTKEEIKEKPTNNNISNTFWSNGTIKRYAKNLQKVDTSEITKRIDSYKTFVKTECSWRHFANYKVFSPPNSTTEAVTRFTKNIIRFRNNYFVITAGISCYAVIVNPYLLLGVGSLLVGHYAIDVNDQKDKYWILAGSSLPLFIYGNLPVQFLKALGLSATAIIFHSLFYSQ